MIEYERYRSGDATYLVVDATNDVRDRRAFAVRHCGSAGGVPGPAADDRDARRGADGVLFLALEPEFRPPRVVTTLVRADGHREPECPDATRSAAAWAARHVPSDRLMIDTQAGTRKAVVHGETTTGGPTEVSVEVDPDRARDAEHPEIPARMAGSTRAAVGVTDGGRETGDVPEGGPPAEPAFSSPEDELAVTLGPVVRESAGEVQEVVP